MNALEQTIKQLKPNEKRWITEYIRDSKISSKVLEFISIVHKSSSIVNNKEICKSLNISPKELYHIKDLTETIINAMTIKLYAHKTPFYNILLSLTYLNIGNEQMALEYTKKIETKKNKLIPIFLKNAIKINLNSSNLDTENWENLLNETAENAKEIYIQYELRKIESSLVRINSSSEKLENITAHIKQLNPKTIENKITQLNILAIINYENQFYEESLIYLEKIISLIQNDENIDHYHLILALRNRIEINIILGNYNFKSSLSLIKSTKVDTENYNYLKECYFISGEIAYLFFHKKWTECIYQFKSNLQTEYYNYLYLNNEWSFYYYTSLSHICLQDLKSGMLLLDQYILKIELRNFSNGKEDYHYYVSLLIIKLIIWTKRDDDYFKKYYIKKIKSILNLFSIKNKKIKTPKK